MREQADSMILLKNVGLRLADNKTILRDISWEIKKNENWVLFGRNGAGKTRLLEIISGYRFPSSGEVWRFGEAPASGDIRETRKRIGYVSTLLQQRFYPKEAVLDVVASGVFASVGLYEEPAQAVYDKAYELLKRAGLAGRERDGFGILSDGEKQKVIMLRAVINNPNILILDEAAKGLDLAAREDFLSLIAELEGRISVIYVTHHVEEIIPVFRNIFILQNGSCLFQGLVSEGITSERLTAVFGRNVNVEKRRNRYYTFL